MVAASLLFYREGSAVPVLDWLDEQSIEAQNRCLVAFERLATEGHAARRPLVENLGRGIYELRVRVGRVNYRILYFFHGRTAVLLTNGFTKEAEIPRGEIELALARKEKFERNPEMYCVEAEE